MKREPCACEVDPRGLQPKVLCETHQAMLRPYHVIPAKGDRLPAPPGGYQVSDGLMGYGWFQTEAEAQRLADSKNAEKG